MTTEIEPQPTHCPSCFAPYQYHQAFGKPLGVIGYSTCECAHMIGSESRPLNTTREETRRRKQRERAEAKVSNRFVRNERLNRMRAAIGEDKVLARKLGWTK